MNLFEVENEKLSMKQFHKILVDNVRVWIQSLVDQYNVNSKGLVWSTSPFPTIIGSLKEKVVGICLCWFSSQSSCYRSVLINCKGLK